MDVVKPLFCTCCQKGFTMLLVLSAISSLQILILQNELEQKTTVAHIIIHLFPVEIDSFIKYDVVQKCGPSGAAAELFFNSLVVIPGFLQLYFLTDTQELML